MSERGVVTDDVVEEIRSHMNSHHLEDSAAIVRHVSADPTIQAAVVTDLDDTAIEFQATCQNGTLRQVKVAWPQPITSRDHIRANLVELTHAARNDGMSGESH